MSSRSPVRWGSCITRGISSRDELVEQHSTKPSLGVPEDGGRMTPPSSSDAERLRDRTSRIKQKLEGEFSGHTCRALGTGVDPSVHRFALNDEHGIARYLLTVLEVTLTDAGIPEPEGLMEKQGAVERMREAGMDGTRLLHPLLEKRLARSR